MAKVSTMQTTNNAKVSTMQTTNNSKVSTMTMWQCGKGVNNDMVKHNPRCFAPLTIFQTVPFKSSFANPTLHMTIYIKQFFKYRSHIAFPSAGIKKPQVSHRLLSKVYLLQPSQEGKEEFEEPAHM